MPQGFLRLLLLSLIGGGLAVVVILALLLPFIGGVAGLSLIQEMQDASPFWLALFGLGVTAFFLFLCCLPMVILLLGPFIASTTVAVVVEREQPFLPSIQQGLSQAWRRYGWWVLTLLGGMTLAVVLNLIPAPFRALSGFLGELRDQGMQTPFFYNALVSGLAEILNAIVGVLQTLALFTLYTVVYLHLREQIAGTSASTPVEKPLPTEFLEPPDEENP